MIGITAVDGRGTLFHGGGRVVKNVAGYDFCKLLTGSLGTLAVITQVTLRVKPIPPRSKFVACRVRNWEMAERVLAGLSKSQTTPAAIELLTGAGWRDDSQLGRLSALEVAHLLVGVEGDEAEVEWMASTLWNELRLLGVAAEILPDSQAGTLWMRLAQFPVAGPSPLVFKAAMRSSRVSDFIELVLKIDPEANVQAHAGSGIVIARMSAAWYESVSAAAGGLSKLLVGQLQPAAAERDGHVVVLSCASPGDLTRQCWWGSLGDSATITEGIKRQFDPKDILNRGRFVYAGR